MASKHPLTILGASARAAAFSALRAGFQPWCADLFADVDLQQVCQAVAVSRQDYPRGLIPHLHQAPPGPWLYTGGMENRSHIVRRLAQVRPLWGMDAGVLRKVRRPWEVARCLAIAGLPTPAVHHGSLPPTHSTRWLVKPLAGAGGIGVHFWPDQPLTLPLNKVYFQQYISGTPVAAIYVGNGQTALLLGVTLQLVGMTWLHAAPFHYCGSIGPLELDQQLHTAFVSLGAALTQGFGLRGVFGVDCILRRNLPWPVEVNPRYTASVEVLEYATDVAALQLHAKAFDTALGRGLRRNRKPTGLVGKAILFAREHLQVPPDGPWLKALNQSVSALRDFADLPTAGQHIEQGHPILTHFVRAPSIKDCLGQLRQSARSLDRWLFAR